METNQASLTEPEITVEEIEKQWWEPLGCKCEVEFEQE